MCTANISRKALISVGASKCAANYENGKAIFFVHLKHIVTVLVMCVIFDADLFMEVNIRCTNISSDNGICCMLDILN